MSSVLSGTGTAPRRIAPRNAAIQSTLSIMQIATRCSGCTPIVAKADAARAVRSATSPYV